jgi:hypothetical protein
MNFNKIVSFYGQYQNDPDLGRVAYNHGYTQKYIKAVIFQQRKKYILMGTYEIHKNFGVCNKSEDENIFMKNKFQIIAIFIFVGCDLYYFYYFEMFYE